jgi:hypothetical protein
MVQKNPATASAKQRLTIDFWLGLLCIAAVLMVDSRLFTARFTNLDDRGTLTENPKFNPPSWQNIGYYWDWNHTAADLYVPLTYTLWGVLALATWVRTPDEAGTHLDPHVFHAANIFLHAVAACLAFRLLRQLKLRPWPSLFGALFFALHPLQAEPVGWTSGTKDVLSGALALAAVCCYVQFAQTENSRRRIWFPIATLAFVMAMLAKPSAAMLPLLVAVVDRWILRRSWRQTIWPVICWLALAFPVLVIARSAQIAQHGSSIPLHFRPALAATAIAFYLGKLLLPIRLAFDYGLRPSAMRHHFWPYLFCVFILIPAIGIWRLRKPWLNAAACWFVICLLPVLGLTSFDWEWYSLVADHYVYLAMFGPAMALAWMLNTYETSPAARTFAVLVLVALACGSFVQSQYWLSDRQLAERAIQINPRSFTSYALIGLEEASHDPEQAIQDCRKSLSIEPGFYAVAEVLELVLANVRRYTEALDVIDQIRHFSDTQPAGQQVDPTRSLRMVARIAEQQGDFGVAEKCYLRILAERSDDADAAAGLQRAFRMPPSHISATTKS